MTRQAERRCSRGTWLSRAVFFLDSYLRRRKGVFEYCAHPDCIFRIQINSVRAPVRLADGTVLRPGDRVIDLHMWNEQLPRFADHGGPLAWARRMTRDLEISLEQLSLYLAANPGLRDVKGVRADVRIAGREMTAQLLRICARFGFAMVPGDLAAPGFVRWLGENILILLFVLARNASALRRDSIWRDPVQIFLSRIALDSRYGAAPTVSERATAPTGVAVVVTSPAPGLRNPPAVSGKELRLGATGLRSTP